MSFGRPMRSRPGRGRSPIGICISGKIRPRGRRKWRRCARATPSGISWGGRFSSSHFRTWLHWSRRRCWSRGRIGGRLRALQLGVALLIELVPFLAVQRVRFLRGLIFFAALFLDRVLGRPFTIRGVEKKPESVAPRSPTQ